MLFVLWCRDAKQVVIFFGQVTAFEMRDATFFEKYDDPAAGDFTVAFADAEGIIRLNKTDAAYEKKREDLVGGR